MRGRKPSIAGKLTRLNMLVSGAALLLASVAFGVYDRAAFREALVSNTSVQAQIVATNSVSALMFHDTLVAESTLEALRASPGIVGAAIYLPDRTLFAEYRRDAGAPGLLMAPTDEVESSVFQDGHLVLARRIVVDGKRIGSVAIESNLDALLARQQDYVRTVAIVFMVSLVAALLLSWVSQRTTSGSIEHLAALSREVSRNRDYSLRATVEPNTREMAELCHTFNDMLTQIQARDRSLLQANLETEETVRQRTAELKAVNQELEAFSYSVSHDLRAPLRHVAGFSDLLQSHAQGALDAQSLRYLNTISGAARKMAKLIDDLLALSRMGRASLTKRRVNLADMVAEVCREVAAAAPERDILWVIQPLPEVSADPAMLRLVLVNLLANAVKYSSTREQSRIEVGALDSPPSEVVVFVSDNGVGFDMAYVDKLFGVFQRLHSDAEFEGTGIGLANVKRIVTRHSGRVWAEGRPNEGATFCFSLPVLEVS